MERAAALQLLKLTTSATREDVLQAFNRLARRYPMAQFPDRHMALLDAKTCLLSNKADFSAVLFDQQIDMSGFAPYLKRQVPNHQDANALRTQVANFMRPILRDTSELKVDESSMGSIFDMMQSMTPQDLAALFRRHFDDS